MTLDLDAIRERARHLLEVVAAVEAGELGAAAISVPAGESARDVPVLLAEINRLNTRIVSLRAEAELLGEAVDRLIAQRGAAD